LAFTTIQGSGANDATSFVGSSGVDIILLQNQEGAAYVGAQASADSVTVQNFTGLNSGFTIKGGQGADTLNNNNTNLLSSLVNGNKDNDSLTYAAVTSTTLFGGQGDDALVVNTLTSSVLNGNKNVDTITVTTSSGSSIFGGQGGDTLNLTTVGSSVVQGDKDNDELNLEGIISGSTLNGNQGNDTININAGVTAFTTSTIYGGAGNDTLAGEGAGAALVLSGDLGNDSVTSGASADTLLGGGGTDTLTGNAGSDSLTGGTEADQFAVGANLVNSVNNAVNADTIVDFSVAQGDSVTGLSIANIELQAAVADLTAAQNATSIGANTAVITATGTFAGNNGGTFDLGTAAAGTNILLISNDFASDAALQTQVRAGLTASNAFGANDAILAVYDNGTDSFLVQISTAGGVNDDAQWADGVVTRLATISGVSDATTLTAAASAWGNILA
jgi:Ca2+-binding RTX toxin-like protein